MNANYVGYKRSNTWAENTAVLYKNVDASCIHEQAHHGNWHTCEYCGQSVLMIAYALTKDETGKIKEDTIKKFNELYPTICGECSYKLFDKILDKGYHLDTLRDIFQATRKAWHKIWYHK
jgi:outer membrane protein assembly factor BamD (BamD/ComL family)